VRVSQAGPDAAAIGKLTREALSSGGAWDKLHGKTTVYKTTVNEVANDVKVGAVDAGIVFDAVLHDYDTLEAVAISELADVKAHVAVAVLSGSKQGAGESLARYIGARYGLARIASWV
jgi:molybdate transport system substrate-binding protein